MTAIIQAAANDTAIQVDWNLAGQAHYVITDQHDEVGDQKGPAPRLVGQVGKPPDVSEAHRVTCTVHALPNSGWSKNGTHDGPVGEREL